MFAKQPIKKSSLFLMELIIVLFFFALCAAVCVNIFIKAKLISNQSYELNKSIIASQNAAECFKAANANINTLAEFLHGTAEGDVVKIGYDKNWQNINMSNAVYLMNINIEKSNKDIYTAVITVYKENLLIYSLAAKHLRKT